MRKLFTLFILTALVIGLTSLGAACSADKEAGSGSGGIPHAFLDQFKGKGHDSKLRLGQDIKAQGVDEAVARAATDAIRLDVVTMQALYGAAHSHGGAHSH